MAKELTTIAQNYPVLANPERLKRVIQSNAAAGFDASQLLRIKWPKPGVDTFQVPDPDGKNGYRAESEITGIILDERNTRAFFEKSYDEAPDQHPVCTSIDGLEGVLSQSVTDETLDLLDERGLRPSGRCHDCPAAKWESGKNGGQACKSRKPLLILQKGDALPSILSLPATSFKSYGNFATGLISKLIMKEEIEVTIGLKEEKGKVSGMSFNAATFQKTASLSESEAAAILDYKENLLKIPTVSSQMADAGLDLNE